MSVSYQMQYQALNLLDEICTVELTIHEEERILHVLDLENAVLPTYHFVEKKFQLSDDFYKMVNVLIKKKILYPNNCRDLSPQQWLQNISIYFYSSRPAIYVYSNGEIEKIDIYLNSVEDNFNALHDVYLQRIAVRKV